MSRIAYFVAGQFIDGSIPILELTRALRELGNDVRLIGYSKSDEIPNEEFTLATPEMASDTSWWKTLDISVVVFYSLAVPLSVLRAARSAGVRVMLDADHEGLLSPWLWKSEWLRRYWDGRHTLLTKARILRLWLKDIRHHRRFENAIIGQMEVADVLKIESNFAKQNVARFLNFTKRSELISKVTVIPFNVRKEIINRQVTSQRERRVVVMGRLEDQQKDPVLLERMIEAIIRRFPDFRIDILSRQVTERFESLARRNPTRLEFIYKADRTRVMKSLEKAIILLSTSRIESLPVSALEAVCMGCGVVAPPLAGFQEICRVRGFGTVAARRTKNSMLEAFAIEQAAWADGRRDSVQISEQARAEFCVAKVADLWRAAIQAQ